MSHSNLRTNRRARLDVYLNKVMDEELFMCRAADISPDGIYLSRLIEPKYEGRQVGLEFTLPGSKEVIWASGEIVRGGYRGGTTGTGIRFVALPQGYRRLIEDWVVQHAA